VLTETDEQVRPNFRYGFHTPKVTEAPPDYFLPAIYKPAENRVSVFANYPCLKQHETYDKYTAICVELETELGNLLVYGTIIGVVGNRHPSYKSDLIRQAGDFERLSKLGHLCICGDYNCSFADNYYFTCFGRDTLLKSFSDNGICLLTKKQLECIDHIAISNKFFPNGNANIWEWNTDKSLSDHKGLMAEIG
jgi:endonuclease/exonuclease/phosphatase family metal-dependent hydrolase